MHSIVANWPEQKNTEHGSVHAFCTTRISVDQYLSKHNPQRLQHPDRYASFNTGLHVGDDPQIVSNNRAQLLKYCGVEHAQWLDQVHGTDCVKATRDNLQLTADATWSDEIDLACIVMTADCLPVAFKQTDKVAVAHAGWRGLAAGVLANTLQVLDPEQTDVWLGPAIGASAFEVGGEVREQFMDLHLSTSSAFVPSVNKGKWLADIYQIARIALVQSGVNGQRIYGGEHCTFTEESVFYSYRRNAQAGRMATVVYRTTP